MNYQDRETIIPEESTITSSSQTDEGQSLIGQTVKGRYQIDKQLAVGGFGVVYLARDLELLGKPVVIKHLRERALGDEWAVNKFQHEIEALTRIDHPGVVGVLDTGKTPDGAHFLVMQYVEGKSLRSIIRPEGMDFERAGDIILQVGQALNAAHEKGVVHRDLKPENIMVQKLGSADRVRIIDFGIAKVRDSLVAPSTKIPAAAGTIAYMAPEQLNARPVSGSTDVYALGAIAYEMLTGRRPFHPETMFQLSEMQRAGVRIRPTDLRPGLSANAENALLKALSYSPADRYPSVSAFAESLANALLEGGLPTPPVDSKAETLPMTGVIARRARKGTAALITVGVILLAATIVLPILWRLSGSRNRLGVDNEKTITTSASSTRTLDYSVTVQKMRAGKAYQEPFQATGREILESGYQVRFNFSSPQLGFLYLINEGPAGGNLDTYNLLFPMPSMNGGSAHLEAGQKLSTNPYTLEKHEGTEKLWIVWSESGVPELEAVKGVVNPKQKGTISDTGQAEAVRAFLEKYSKINPEIETNETTKVNHVIAHGDILVDLMKLEHR